jgi:flagellar hook-associated protein 3 FlgL
MSQASSLYYLRRNLTAVSELNNRLSASRRVLKLSDDPTSAVNGIKLTNTISRIEQYLRNIASAAGTLALVDGHLASLKSSLDSVSTALIAAASDSTTAEQRQTCAAELESLLQQLVLAANARDGERYVFGGTNTSSEPFSIVNGYVAYNGNDQSILAQTGRTAAAAVNCTGTNAFGNMLTTVSSTGDLNPSVNLATDVSTKLSDLNAGSGVPSGKIMIYYSAYPEGLEVDLSSCDTLEDVKDRIEQATLDASRALDPSGCPWLDGDTLDWRDLQDRYVKVTANPDGNGISLQEFDLGETLPAPTEREKRLGLDYSGAPGYAAGGAGVGAGAIYDRADYIYGDGSGCYVALRVGEVAANKVAAGLGIRGTANGYDPAAPDAALDGYIHGSDLDPVVSKSTLLADLAGYNDAVYSISNGSIPGNVAVLETSSDSNHVFGNWDLNNLSLNDNTGPNGELYARVTRRDPPADDIYVEIYAAPPDKAKASDLVASGSYAGAQDGGAVKLTEANGSGVSGSVSILLPTTVSGASVELRAEFAGDLQATVHVPAFVEETDAKGSSLDYLNILSGWQITGLDKPPADGYDLNHPASTDLDGDVAVNMRLVDNGAATSLVVELYRPAYGDQPAALIASGELDLGGQPPLAAAASGRIAVTGAEGFEGVSGSVYVEFPAGVEFSSGTVGAGAASATTHTYALTGDLAASSELVTGGALRLTADQELGADLTLAADTTFLKGQAFANDVSIPGMGVFPAGAALSADTVIPKGTAIGAGTVLSAGTVLAAGQTVAFADGLAAGTVIPEGSYTTDPAAGFPADSMTSSDPARAGQAMGFDLTATFATVEDLARAVEEAGIYVSVNVSEDGKGLEFASRLAGAYLTVSEDVDCCEQMGDVDNQLSKLDLNGLVKGVNSDVNGSVYVEVVHYPPDASRTDGKTLLLSASGEQVLVDAGYYVRIYSDPEALNANYEDRDHSSLVAEGFAAAGVYDGTDPLNPYVPATAGSASPLILEERNDSGVSGTVALDYYGGRDQAALLADGTYDVSPYDNANITVTPGGLRTNGSAHSTIQEIDVSGFIPGVHSDFSGTAHAAISWDEASSTTTVTVYRDASHTHATCKGELNARTGTVVLYETDKKGNYALDADGNRIRAGELTLAVNLLPDGQSDNFTFATGSLGASGQEREENVFSTLVDAIVALKANDVEALHNQIDAVAADIDRVLNAAGNVGARVDQLELLAERHETDLVTYQSMLTAAIGMDENVFAETTVQVLAAETAYNASMQLAARYLQMSLLNYL